MILIGQSVIRVKLRKAGFTSGWVEITHNDVA